MLRMLAPRNMGSMNIGGHKVEPDSKGIIQVPDDVPASVLNDLRSHGFMDIPGRVDPADDVESQLRSALARCQNLEDQLAAANESAAQSDAARIAAETELAECKKQLAAAPQPEAAPQADSSEKAKK